MKYHVIRIRHDDLVGYVNALKFIKQCTRSIDIPCSYDSWRRFDFLLYNLEKFL